MANPYLLDPKQPEEKYFIRSDINPILAGATPGSPTISAKDRDTGLPANIVDFTSLTNGILTFFIRDGKIGQRYAITATIPTTTGESYEIDYYLDVVDIYQPIILEPKEPLTIIDRGIHFSSVLEDGSISQVDLRAIDLSTGSSADVFEDLGFQNSLVSIRLKNGTHGKTYRISAKVLSTLGETFIEDLFMPVMEH